MSVQIPDRKIWAFGAEAQSKIAEGLRKSVEVVASTLGPAGANVLIERKFRTPIAPDDGITAIQNLILDDELENLAATSLVDAAGKTSEHVGDGTSTTIVLTVAAYEEGRKRVGEGALMMGKTPFEIRNEMFEARDIVLKELKKMAKKIETKKDIRAVAYSAYANDEMADTVADLVSTVGENGIVIVEEGWGRETEVELLTGMRFAGKLADRFFANTPEDGLSLSALPILVSDFDFVNMNDCQAIVQDMAKAGEEGVIIIANKYERMAIDQIIHTNKFNAQNRSPFRIHLVRTPSWTPGEYEDFATYVGGRYFSKEQGDKVLECQPGDLGRTGSFKVSKIGDGIALAGGGSKKDVDKRILELKLKLEDEKVKLIKARLEQRIASLASSIGIIKVASPSEAETEHIRLKTRNAVKSAQAAVAEGVVRGGGLALKEIADKLPEGNILKEALKAPYETIQKNAGGKLKIPEIYDAVKVIRTALEQACSQACLLINTRTAIAFRSERTNDDAAEIIAAGFGNMPKPSRKEYD
jgi:chaperonin GroEL